ncbi:proton-coupled amino acid transporter-like protein CG1139 isoform X1 [Bactrocera oleae]|uniref:proton-coupled amino acid transporter-like protein CG1139 isoform X1 n=3 Tax=Bactrocera oleae TaxID=104688 RepID=UPI00387E6251
MAEKSEKNDYDPYEHREVPHPISDFGAFVNIFKAVLGTGILAAPMAIRNAGYLPAIICTNIIGIFVVHSKFILLAGMYALAKRKQVPLLTYSQAMLIGVTEGPPALRWLQHLISGIVNVMLFANHFGTCCVYVVFIANCLKDFGDYYWEEHDNRIYMAMEIVPLCLIFLIPNLRALTPFVIIANISLIFGFGILFYYIFTDMRPFSELAMVQDIYLFPFFFGATMFAFDSPGLIVSVEANMKNPLHFRRICGVFVLAMLLVIGFQIVFGFFGYWSYAESIASTILQNIPYNAVPAVAARVIFAFSIFISHPLQGYVPVDVLWNNWLKAKVTEEHQFVLEMLFRVIIAISSVLIAISCPSLTIILSLVGALCMSFLGLILPAILDICVKYDIGYGPIKIYLLSSLLLVILGLVGAIIGTYVSIQEWIFTYTRENHMMKTLYYGVFNEKYSDFI